MMLKLPKILLETIYISGLKLLNFQISYARELEAQKCLRHFFNLSIFIVILQWLWSCGLNCIEIIYTYL